MIKVIVVIVMKGHYFKVITRFITESKARIENVRAFFMFQSVFYIERVIV